MSAVEILADALGLQPGEVTENTALGVTSEWNSLAHLRLILGLEERLGRQLTPDQIVSLAGLADVKAILDAADD